MSRGRKFVDKDPDEEMEQDDYDQGEYGVEVEDPGEKEMEEEDYDQEEYGVEVEDPGEKKVEEEDYDQEEYGVEVEDPGSGPRILSDGPPPEKMRRCDASQCLYHDWISSSGDHDGLHLSSIDDQPQDADYRDLPQLSDELETMILARFPILEFRKLRLVNKGVLALITNGDLLKERRLLGVREAYVFMLASGEENWWAFDQHFNSPKMLPTLPCDVTFQTADKETLCAGTHLLVCGYSYELEGSVVWTYDVIMNKWYRGSSMIQSRCLFASASCGDFAFVAGGINSEKINESETKEVLKSAEKYDPKTKTWEPIPKMHERRKMCAGFYMDDKFHVIGGHNENGDLTCGEVFDEKRNKWDKIPGMLNNLATSHSPPLVAVVNNELYLFETSANCLMVYLKDSNSWKNLGDVPVRADINKGWGVAFKSIGTELLVIGASTSSLSGGINIYTCSPNPNLDGLNWKCLRGTGCGRSNFIRNCAVMIA